MKVPVISSKFAAPLLPASYLPRERLDRLWHKWVAKRLVLVTAGAGFGKTCFLAAHTRAAGPNCIWYSLDEPDTELATFCAHLALAVGLSEAERAGKAQPAGRVGFAGQALASVVRSLRERQAGTLLVLDDVHLVAGSAEVLGFLERLIRFLPEGVTLVLAAREPVEIATMKLRSLGAVAAVSARELRFTDEEVQALFKRRFRGASLESRLARRIVARTEGWAAGIEILFQALEGTSSWAVEEALEQLASAGADWFAYFAEEVVSRLDPQTQDFLRRSSVLAQLDADLCDQLLGRRNSREILERLCKRNLFTFPSGPDAGSFRYHHLFRSFLGDQLRCALSEVDLRKLQRRAARVLVKAGAGAEAVAAYIDAGDLEGALRLVEKEGEDLLATGRYGTIHRALESIPRKDLNKRPVALFLLGRLSDSQGHWEEAEAIYRKVLRITPRGARRAELLRLLARLKSRWGEYAACLSLCKRALAQPGPKGAQTRADILITSGVSACELGRIAEGERELKQAAAIFRKRKDTLGEGRILCLLAMNVHCPRGEFHIAKAAARRALAIFRKLRDSRRACQALGVLAHVTVSAGEERDARDLATEALRTAEALEFHALEGYCHWSLGKCALISGNPSQAREEFEAALRYGELLGETELRMIPRLGLAEVALTCGNRHAAQRIAAETLEIARGMKDLLQEGQSHRLLGLAACESHPKRAFKHWNRAETVFRRVGAAFELHHLLLLRLASGDLPEKRRPAALAELLAGAARLEHDSLFLVLEPERSAGVLAEALRLGIEIEHVTRLLLQLGGPVVPCLRPLVEDASQTIRRRAVELLAQIGGDEARAMLARVADDTTRVGRAALKATEELERAPGVPLDIRALGALSVLVGERRLPHGSWRSARALRLFQFLLVSRFRWVPRDVVLDTLWPEAEPEKAVNSLRQAIHVLRKTLEPGLKKALYSQYVRFRNEACRLDPGEGYFYDVEEFESAFQKAEALWGAGKQRRAEPLLRKAVGLCRGDFLAESLYEDFTAPEREHLRDRLLRAIGRLLTLCESSRRWEEAVPLCRRGLAQDPFSEDFYRHLVHAQLQLGNRREALAGYHRYEEMMVGEMGLLPSARMKALADKVVALGKVGKR